MNYHNYLIFLRRLKLSWPRPLFPEYNKFYNKKQKLDYQFIQELGWAQVNEKEIQLGKRLDLDIWYVENRSIVLDITILLKNIFC